jgi:hypothetical protein
VGLMAQCEQKTLYYEATTENLETGYIDLASSMTAANRKQYHQVGGDGTAKCFRVMVTAIKGEVTFSHMQNSFLICNAVKQTTAGWKAQLRHAGIKLRDLPPYGRRPRFALETGAVNKNTTGLAGEEIYEISSSHPKADLSPGGNSFFQNYVATDGDTITYASLSPNAVPIAGSHAANMITQVTITDGAGVEDNQPLVLSGAAVVNEFNVIFEYLQARRGTPDVSIDTPGPTVDSPMLNLFSVSEEMSDDIVEGIEDYMDWKPYTPDKSGNHFDELTEGCMISSSTTGTSTNVAVPGGNTSISNHYPGASAVMDVPLGLLKYVCGTSNQFRVDVLAIYEM